MTQQTVLADQPSRFPVAQLLSEAFMIVDAETLGYVEANAAACELLGVPHERLLATPAGASVYGGHAPATLRAYHAELIRQAPAEARSDERLTRSDGSAVDVRLVHRAFQHDGRWHVMVRAEAKAFHEAGTTAATLARHRTIARLSGGALVMADAETLQFLEISDSACALVGMTRDMLMAVGPAKALGLSSHMLKETYNHMIATSPQLETRDVLLRLGGRRMEMQITSYATRADGRWVIYTTLEDLTREREDARDLERLRLAIDQAADAVTMVDAETCDYIYVNMAACTLLGYTREECLALKPWQTDAVHRDPEEVRNRYRVLTRMSPQVQHEEGELLRRDGTAVPMEFSRGVVWLAGRWVLVETGRDITERKRSQAELDRRMADLLRSNQELERFAYVASHDLSEPLRMVASYTQLLERRYGPQLDDEAREFIGFAVDGARRMKRLIDDLLAYSRAGRTMKPAAAVDMNTVLEDARGNLQQLIADTGAVVSSDPLPAVQGDAGALVHLLQNLLANAIKFRREGVAPCVHVGWQGEAGERVFSVRDNGMGIEPQYFDRIFIVFQRLHTQDKVPGTGIGLAICKKIVEGHGGRIWVESVPGEGATFFFTLSARETSSPRQAPASGDQGDVDQGRG